MRRASRDSPEEREFAMVLKAREPYSPQAGAVARVVRELCGHRADHAVRVVTARRDDNWSGPERVVQVSASSLARFLPWRSNRDVFVSNAIRACEGAPVIVLQNCAGYAKAFRAHYGDAASILLHAHNEPAAEGLRYVDGVVAVSEYLAGTIRPHVRPGVRVEVSLNGADIERFVPAPSLREPDLMVFCGRVEPGKGVRELMRAYAVLRERGDRTRLVVIGSHGFGLRQHRSEYVAEVESLAVGLGVEFTGFIPNDEVHRWYQRAAILAVPSVSNDPCPLTVLEGMAAGCAVVTSSRGGIPEEVGDTAVLVDPTDTQAFADALERLSTEDGLCADFGRRARERAVASFSWRDRAADFWRVLTRLSAG